MISDWSFDFDNLLILRIYIVRLNYFERSLSVTQFKVIGIQNESLINGSLNNFFNQNSDLD